MGRFITLLVQVAFIEKKEKILKMSFLRRSNQSLLQSIRQLTITNIAKTNRENAVRAVGVAGGLNIVQATQMVPDRKEAARSLVAHIKSMVNVSPDCMIGNNKSAFSMPVGAKIVMTSQSDRVEKMFASFDLGSVSISFVGMMGDFAVWAITDLSTGEIMYLIDDNC